MADKTVKISGLILTTALLAGGFTHASASGELPIFEACLAKVPEAANPEQARDQCFWNHWDLMASAGN